MTPTIDEVLETHLPEFHDTTNFLKNCIYAAMTEWASLNRQGWTDELIKEMIYQKCAIQENYFGNVQKMLDDFKESKPEIDWMPLPSKPGDESCQCDKDKEIERLKGLIERLVTDKYYLANTPRQTTVRWISLPVPPVSIEKYREQYAIENNL
jgi:hypothetical protein